MRVGQPWSRQLASSLFFGQIFTWEKKALLLNLESWGFDPRGISDLGADLGRDCRWGGAHGCSHPSARGGPAAPAPPLQRLLRRSARLTLLQAHCVLPWPPFLCTRCRCPPRSPGPAHRSLSAPSPPPTPQWPSDRVTSTSVTIPGRVNGLLGARSASELCEPHLSAPAARGFS